MKKKIYIAPKTVSYEVENVLYQSFSVVTKTDSGEKIIDQGPVVEDKDPDGLTNGSWFDRYENWGGD